MNRQPFTGWYLVAAFMAVLGLGSAAAAAPQAAGSRLSPCFVEAYRFLPRQGAKTLCEGTTSAETALCYGEVRSHLTQDQAMRLCRGGSLRTAVCYGRSVGTLGVEESLKLCSEAGTEATAACFADASRQLSHVDAVRLCHGGGDLARSACALSALGDADGLTDAALQRCGARL